MAKSSKPIEKSVETEDNLPVDTSADSDEIIVKDPQVLRPVELPLVVTLPEGSSKAQIEYAKVLNAYAYKNPEKWAVKRDVLIAKLKALKNAPDPVEGNLKFGKKNVI